MRSDRGYCRSVCGCLAAVDAVRPAVAKGWAVARNTGADAFPEKGFADHLKDALLVDNGKKLGQGLDSRLYDDIGIAADIFELPILFNNGQEVIAVHLRHHDVEKDQVKLFSEIVIDGLGRRGYRGDFDLLTEATDEFFQEDTIDILIIHHQNSGLGGWRGFGQLYGGLAGKGGQGGAQIMGGAVAHVAVAGLTQLGKKLQNCFDKGRFGLSVGLAGAVQAVCRQGGEAGDVIEIKEACHTVQGAQGVGAVANQLGIFGCLLGSQKMLLCIIDKGRCIILKGEVVIGHAAVSWFLKCLFGRFPCFRAHPVNGCKMFMVEEWFCCRLCRV